MAYSHNETTSAESTWKTKLFDLTFAPLYCQVSYHTSRPTKELSHQCTLYQWHTAQQTIWMGFSKYRRSHTVIIFIILMNEKSVSISVYIENKTTKIRLSPCVDITFCSHLSLFMNVNIIRHWRMLSHLCRIMVLWFPLKRISLRKLALIATMLT